METDGKVYVYSVYDETYNVHVVKDRYNTGDNRVALLLRDADDGGAVAVATTNFPDVPLEPGYVLIKTWAENERMLEFLVTNGIVEPTDRGIDVGHGNFAVMCRLLI